MVKPQSPFKKQTPTTAENNGFAKYCTVGQFALMLCLALLYAEMSRNCREREGFLRPSSSTLPSTSNNLPAKGCGSLERRLIQKTLKNIMAQTSCPDSSGWLNDYLAEASTTEPFIFLNFGCNKGFDALFVAQSISRNVEVFDKQKWTDGLDGIGGPGVCGQGLLSNPGPAIDPSLPRRPVEVYCVEATPRIYEKLRRAAEVTGAKDHGLYVHHYAMSGTPGGQPILFPNPDGSNGREDLSISYCNDPGYRASCVPVPSKTIDEFVKENVKQKNKRIPFITIDTEGWDFTLMKAATETLKRTDYLEFEYHAKGDWEKQKLEDAMLMLKSHGFVCYWAGKNKLWKLTDSCWMGYFEFHNWSNVACVNPTFAPKLAERMEQIFEDTLVV